MEGQLTNHPNRSPWRFAVWDGREEGFHARFLHETEAAGYAQWFSRTWVPSISVVVLDAGRITIQYQNGKRVAP